jgi:hypothetical protein
MSEENGLYASAKGERKIEPIPQDLYQVVCCWVIDLGTHIDTKYNKTRRMVQIGWEIPEVKRKFTKDGKEIEENAIISKRYSLGLSEKSTLYKDLKSWRGVPFTADELKKFNVAKLIGANALVQVVHEPSRKDPSKVYANLGSILPIKKGSNSVKFEPTDGGLFWSIPAQKDPSFKFRIPSNIPKFIADKIRESAEFTNYGDTTELPAGCDSPATGGSSDDTSEDVPF